MAQGVPSTNMIYPAAPISLVNKSKTGVDSIQLGGMIYNQYAATAAVANSTTETTLFNQSATTSLGSLTIPAGAMSAGDKIQTTTGPGTRLRIRLVGTIGNTGTPNITFALKTGSTVLSTSGAVAMTTITGTGRFEAEFNLVVYAYGTTGSINAEGYAMYNSTVIPTANTNTTSFDTTAALPLNVTVTWGAASASNTLTVTQAFILIDY